MFQGTQRIPNLVYLPNPVNRRHPYAQALQAWWLAVPGRFGGLKWYDLMGVNHGALTSMANSTNGFATSPLHSGGFGAVLFDGTAGYIDTGNGAATQNLALVGAAQPSWSTWSFWINPTVNTTGTILARNDGDAVSPGWWISLEAGPKLMLTCERAAVNDANTITAPATGVWSHVLITADTSQSNLFATCAMYVNGIAQSVTHSATGSGASATDATRNFIIGRWSTLAAGGHGFFQGYMNDVRVYSQRPFGAREAYGLYDNSRRGCPGILNRIHRQLPKGAAAVTSGLLMRRRRELLGA